MTWLITGWVHLIGSSPFEDYLIITTSICRSSLRPISFTSRVVFAILVALFQRHRTLINGQWWARCRGICIDMHCAASQAGRLGELASYCGQARNHCLKLVPWRWNRATEIARKIAKTARDVKVIDVKWR